MLQHCSAQHQNCRPRIALHARPWAWWPSKQHTSLDSFCISQLTKIKCHCRADWLQRWTTARFNNTTNSRLGAQPMLRADNRSKGQVSLAQIAERLQETPRLQVFLAPTALLPCSSSCHREIQCRHRASRLRRPSTSSPMCARNQGVPDSHRADMRLTGYSSSRFRRNVLLPGSLDASLSAT